MLCMFVDIGLKFYAVPSQVTLRSRSRVIDFDRFSGKAQVRRATLSCDSSYLLLVIYILGQNIPVGFFFDVYLDFFQCAGQGLAKPSLG